MTIETFDEVMQLLLTDVGRCATTKICKSQLTPLEGARTRVELCLFNQSIDVLLDLTGVLVCVDFEITKLASFTAKWDV